MPVYWTLFAWPAISALLKMRLSRQAARYSLLLYAVFLTLIIGLRVEVGVDWGNYLDHYDTAASSTLLQAMQTNDPAYGFLNWVAAAMGLKIWLVNLVCAAVYVTGIVILCREFPNPWLGMTIAVPFMGIVVGMNYTRQSAALGCIFWAIVALQREKSLRFAILVVIGALFHRTAAIVFPLGALMYSPNRYWRLFWVTGGFILAYYVFLAESSDNLIETYWRNPMVSDGTVVRVLMNGTAGLCILILGKRFEVSDRVFRFWRLYAVTSIPFIVAIIALPPLTAIDRIALYWMPLQVYAFAHLPAAVRKWGLSGIAEAAAVLGYASVQFVWLVYATYSFAWFPYKFYPLEYLFGGLNF
ncbi:MAG: hypothetical protein RJA70_4903 [Pseudomonadota bacterium]|jgi:hypothetical protein